MLDDWSSLPEDYVWQEPVRALNAYKGPKLAQRPIGLQTGEDNGMEAGVSVPLVGIVARRRAIVSVVEAMSLGVARPAVGSEEARSLAFYVHWPDPPGIGHSDP